MDNTERQNRIVLIDRKRPKRKKVLARGRGRKTVGAILTARLLPFRFAMRSGLAKRGYHVHAMDFKTTIGTYYNEFGAGGPGAKKIDVSAFINSVAFKITPDDQVTGDLDETRNRLAFAEVAAMADEIINIFRSAKFRYQTLVTQGLPPRQFMTDEQLTQAHAVFIVEERLLKKLDGDHFLKKDEFWGFLKWAGIILLTWYLIKEL